SPLLAQLTQPLAEPTAKEHVLIQIQPKAPLFLEDGVGANDVMPTALAFQHGNLQSIHMPPTRFQCSAIMSIPRELVGVATPTVSAIPVNFADLLADPP